MTPTEGWGIKDERISYYPVEPDPAGDTPWPAAPRRRSDLRMRVLIGLAAAVIAMLVVLVILTVADGRAARSSTAAVTVASALVPEA